MTPSATPPSAEFQLGFLSKLQRVFSEGDFTATYKFALLVALAELAVEKGEDNSSTLAVTIRQIAERFIQLYWQQATPYGTGAPGSAPGVLVQNVGVQAAVLTAICEFRSSCPYPSAQQARSTAGYAELSRRWRG